MRTYKDAKTMAKSLRDSLAATDVSLSHSEYLEIVAKQFGKSQHEVRSLIEGACRKRKEAPCVFICDECVAFSAQVTADRVGTAEEVKESSNAHLGQRTQQSRHP